MAIHLSPNPNQKGNEVVGGLVSDEFLASSDSVLEKNRGFGTKGAQQWYTPDTAAKLIAKVLGETNFVLDPTAGDGSLLKHFTPERRYGVEVDPDQIEYARQKEPSQEYRAIRGDIQHVYTLLSKTLTFPAIVMNPPFGLKWQEPSLNDGERRNSAVLTLQMMMRLLDPGFGQFAFICGRNRFDRLIGGHEDAAGIYAVIDVPDLFEGTRTDSILAFGVHPKIRENVELLERFERRSMNLENLDLLYPWIEEQRGFASGGRRFAVQHHMMIDPREWRAVEGEYEARLAERLGEAEREFDVRFFGGNNLDIKPSAYTSIVLAKLGKAHQINKLNKLNANYFIQNERDWHALQALEQDGLLTIDPKVIVGIEELLEEHKKHTCPLYALTPAMRLGYLEEYDSLLCTETDSDRGFEKGMRYDLACDTATLEQTERRLEQIKGGKRAGEFEERTYTSYRKVMRIRVGHWTLTDSEKDAADIQYLIDHFDIPQVPDIAERFPAEVQAMRDLVQQIEDEVIYPNSLAYFEKTKDPKYPPVRLKPFQKENIARLLLKRSGLLAWEQGLGKTLAGIIYSIAAIRLGAKERVLIICPKDLIPQWQRELDRFLKKQFELIDGKNHSFMAVDDNGNRKLVNCPQAQAHSVNRRLRANGTGWFISYPEALATNGTQRSQPLPDIVVDEQEIQELVKGTDVYGYWFVDPEKGYRVRGNEAKVRDFRVEKGWETGYGEVPARFELSTKTITSREVCPRCRADKRSGWNGLYCESPQANGSECGYSHYAARVKPAASFLTTTFKKGVVINDEVTMIAGSKSAQGTAGSKRSLAVRGIRARYKLGMTGTPIKNYINQAFWVLWWTLGNQSPRFGYGYDQKTKFEENFAVIEVYRTQKDNNQRGRAVLPEITNLSRFWRQASSGIIRMRKEDTGEPIVPRFFFPIATPLGVAQQRQADKWAKCFTSWFMEEHPDSGATLAGPEFIQTNARMLGLNSKLEWAEIIPESDSHSEWNPDDKADPLAKYQDIEVSNYTPAIFKALELSMALVKDGRKVLVGSPFPSTSQFVAERLVEKGVKAIHVMENGVTQSPDKRAKTVYSFQSDESVQVLCTGVNAVRFGHNLDSGQAVILLGLPWDFETMDQFIARIHRLTSKLPVDVFIILPGGESESTLTAKKWRLLTLKGEASSLALDGHIVKRTEIPQTKDEIFEELQAKGIQADGTEIPEEHVRKAWEDFPMLMWYQPAEGVLPKRPEPPPPLTFGDEALLKLGSFLRSCVGAVRVPFTEPLAPFFKEPVYWGPFVEEQFLPLELPAPVSNSHDKVANATWDSGVPQLASVPDPVEVKPDVDNQEPDVEDEPAGTVVELPKPQIDPMQAIFDELLAIRAENAELKTKLEKVEAAQLSLNLGEN